MSHVLHRMTVPIVVAPMAGGPTTPEMVVAAAHAGAVSALAWGTCSLDTAREQAAHVKGSGVPFGVNLFHPQEERPEQAAASVAHGEGVELGPVDYTFGWDEKLDLALGSGAAFVWSMFGGFTEEEVERIHAAGAEAWTTVTSVEEAQAALADVLCVQGHAAGGHRGTWTLEGEPNEEGIGTLVPAVARIRDVPLIAAGGIRTAADVDAALALPGAHAVSCGSAFLLADEAGTSSANRAAVARGGETVSTRAFSGRYARGLATNYTRAHADMAPIYPHLNAILAGRRAAGDDDVAYCLVGVYPEKIRGGSVADLLGQLSSSGH